MSRKEFVILAVITTIVIFVWIIADIIHTKSAVLVLPQVEKALTPLNPNFDQDTLDKIKSLKNQPLVTPTPLSVSTPPEQIINNQ